MTDHFKCRASRRLVALRPGDRATMHQSFGQTGACLTVGSRISAACSCAVIGLTGWAVILTGKSQLWVVKEWYPRLWQALQHQDSRDEPWQSSRCLQSPKSLPRSSNCRNQNLHL